MTLSESCIHRASDIDDLQYWVGKKDFNVEVAVIKKSIRSAWRRKFGDICQSCDRPMLFDEKSRNHRRYATIDHILARALDGTNELYNIQIICLECNNEKSKKEFRKNPIDT